MTSLPQGSDDHSNRIFGLDILRAMAIIFVMHAHSRFWLEPYVNKSILNTLQIDGVNVFFVLSGFLIGRILLKIYFKENDLSWSELKTFWIRRWYRTVPPYFIMLTILIGYNLYLDLPWRSDYYKFYLFIQNLWYVHPSFFSEAWSLSIEEWFYISFPLLLFFTAIVLKKRSKQDLLFIMGIIFLISIASRTFYYLEGINNGMDYIKIYKLYLRKIVICRLDSMMIGVLAAYIFRFHELIWNRWKNQYFILGLSLLIIYKIYPWQVYSPIYGIFSFTLLSFSVFFMLPKLNSIRKVKGIIGKVIVWISLNVD